ncbi:MAG TPA: serine hydrolase domain-containing protein [Yinghuangia sp.]|uniref:serine hydrolase domain-containing protein n=1 Tax=Yinghuangia sp. YIM S10712 TaxID=3436930 RepID=UPI002CC3F263|nr:serine hydrolase domain-containing protein [Yinghuangia sp.]
MSEHHIRRRIGVVAVALAALAAATAPAATAPDAAPPDAGIGGPGSVLQRDADAVTAAGAVGVLAELRADERRWTARSGVAELDTGQPVPPDASLRIGSATKAFTAVVVLQLADEGRIALEDTVERWLPGVVTGNGNDGSRITVRQLLQHTSGLPQVFDLPGGESAAEFLRHRYDSHTPEHILRLAMNHPPSTAPGTRWEYSNTNYVLLGMIVERVTGKSWAYEVMRRILVPMSLQDTMVPGDNPFLPRPRLHTYRQFAPGESWLDTTDLNVKDMDAEGSIVSTTADLGRFWTALMRGELLSPRMTAEMQRTVPVDVPGYESFGIRWGLGLTWVNLTCGGGYWTHWGNVLGASTRGGVTPDGRRSVVVAVTGNADHTIAETDTGLVLPMVDRALCERTP